MAERLTDADPANPPTDQIKKIEGAMYRKYTGSSYSVGDWLKYERIFPVYTTKSVTAGTTMF